jgi:predicted Zn-dependent peptidase
VRGALSLFQETVSSGVRRADSEPPPVLTRLGLLDRYRRRYPPSRLVVAVVGAVDPAQAVAAVGNAFPVPPSAVPPVPRPPGDDRPSGSPLPAVAPTTVFRTSTTSTDANAIIGYPTFPPNDPSRMAADVLADVLVGEARLAAALRDDRTAGCRASLRAGAPGAAGTLAVAVTCAPAALDGAVEAVRAELARVATQGVTPDEVSRATRRLTGARAATLRTGMAVAHALATDEAQGLPMLSYQRGVSALAAVTAADVTRVARVVLDPRREVIAVVRPPGAPPAPARTAANADKKSDRKRSAD